MRHGLRPSEWFSGLGMLGLWGKNLSHSPKANRPFNLLVSLIWVPIFSKGPKRLTFYFQVLWASELLGGGAWLKGNPGPGL